MDLECLYLPPPFSVVLTMLGKADLRKSHIELSTSMRHLAVVLLTLFYADLDLLQPSPSSVPPSQDLNAQNAQLDSTMKNSQSSSGDTLTPGEFDVVKTALAALALAVKVRNGEYRERFVRLGLILRFIV